MDVVNTEILTVYGRFLDSIEGLIDSLINGMRPLSLSEHAERDYVHWRS